MKRSLIALAAIPLVLVMASAAQAKGAMPQSAQLSGPGLDKPMSFGPTSSGRSGPGQDGNLNLLATETRLFETLFGDRVGSAPSSTLGPRYTITWTMQRELSPGKTFDVHSDLYPFAKGGAVMFTHGGQKVRDTAGTHILHSGWARANPVITDNLLAWGLPKYHPAGASAPTASPPLWLIPLGLVTLVFVAAMARSRRRPVAVPAP
jgi:hypothetical protein